jgi:hypothetical protein
MVIQVNDLLSWQSELDAANANADAKYKLISAQLVHEAEEQNKLEEAKELWLHQGREIIVLHKILCIFHKILHKMTILEWIPVMVDTVLLKIWLVEFVLMTNFRVFE